ncbi:MAG: DUF4340 domain-containing protein [Pseudomonadales bacterium]
MKRSTLATILVIQILLVGLVWGVRLGVDEQGPESLLRFEPDSIERIEISSSGEEGGVALVLEADQWKLASGIPADPDKVEKFLTKLADINSGWPIAEQDSTAQRFEVTDEKHQRRIVVYDAEKPVGDLYLGTSPGYRKVHARSADGGPVYSIKFSVYQVGMDSSSWIDRSLLAATGEVQALALEGAFSLSNGAEGWVSDEDDELDQEAVETLIDRFRNLTVMDIYDEPVSDEPILTYVVTDDEGPQRLSIVRLENAEEDTTTLRYVISSNRRQGHYELASYIAERIETTVDDLVAMPSEGEEVDVVVDE